MSGRSEFTIAPNGCSVSWHLGLARTLVVNRARQEATAMKPQPINKLTGIAHVVEWHEGAPVLRANHERQH